MQCRVRAVQRPCRGWMKRWRCHGNGRRGAHVVVLATATDSTTQSVSPPATDGCVQENAERSWQHAVRPAFVRKIKQNFHTRVRDHASGNPTGFAVTWLGTSSGCPTLFRNTSTTAVRLGPEPSVSLSSSQRGDAEAVALVDTGEGAQYNLTAAGIDLRTVQYVFLTHHHGDHCFGLPALLRARARAFAEAGQSVEPLNIFGPPGTIDFVLGSTLPDPLMAVESAPTQRAPPQVRVTEWSLRRHNPRATTVSHGGVHFTIARKGPDQGREGANLGPQTQFAESHVPGSSNRQRTMPVWEGLSWSARGPHGSVVRAAQLHHRVPCWGYVFQVARGRATVPDVVQERPDASGERARKACILGDTCDSRAIVPLAKGCDLLSHEATFVAEMSHKAAVATHSTGAQAGAFARDVGARCLVLTHFSGRFASGGVSPSPSADSDSETAMRGDLRRLRAEAARAAGDSVQVACAFDGFTWRLPRRGEATDDARALPAPWASKDSLLQ